MGENRAVELRRSTRKVVELEAMLWSQAARARGVIVVMSEVGCRMNVEEAVDGSTDMHMSFTLPYAEATIRCDARVVWSESRSLGVEFLRMREDDKKVLGRWLETHARQEVAG